MALLKQKEEALLEYEEPGKQELKEQFIQLRAKGFSYRRISEKLDVSIGALSNWNNELEGEIATLKAEELEALYEKFYMTREQKISQLGQQLREIQKEIASRDYSEIPIDKLLDMELRVYQALEDEKIELKPLSIQEIEELKS